MVRGATQGEPSPIMNRDEYLARQYLQAVANDPNNPALTPEEFARLSIANPPRTLWRDAADCILAYEECIKRDSRLVCENERKACLNDQCPGAAP